MSKNRKLATTTIRQSGHGYFVYTVYSTVSSTYYLRAALSYDFPDSQYLATAETYNSFCIHDCDFFAQNTVYILVLIILS